MTRIEQTLRLLGPLSVFAQPDSATSGSIAISSHDASVAHVGHLSRLKPIPLRNKNDQIDLILFATISYEVEQDASHQSIWSVRQSSYMFSISDGSGRKLLAFHFHPGGQSWHTGFHAHAETAAPRFLHRLGNGNELTREIFSHKVHIPTPEIQVEDLVELLRSDFGVKLTEEDPRRVDRLLASIRETRRQAP